MPLNFAYMTDIIKTRGCLWAPAKPTIRIKYKAGKFNQTQFTVVLNKVSQPSY